MVDPASHSRQAIDLLFSRLRHLLTFQSAALNNRELLWLIRQYNAEITKKQNKASTAGSPCCCDELQLMLSRAWWILRERPNKSREIESEMESMRIGAEEICDYGDDGRCG